MRNGWRLQESSFFGTKFKRFRKKNPELVELILDNLDSYHQALQQGINPLNISAGYIHHEPQGVKAIDQKGSRKKFSGTPKQGRLYVYPDCDTCTLHLITIGDKNSQSDDLADCGMFMRNLKKNQRSGHGQ